MFCPRCGTVAAGQPPTQCARCGGGLARPENTDHPEPPVPRAPTLRGEIAQRAAGVTPQVLARPKPRPAWTPPHPPPPAPPSSGGNPAPVPPENWPPPPAQWEPAGPGRWAPPPPPGPATSQPSPAPSSSRNWTGTAALRSRISNTLPWQQRTSTQEPPPTYFWQSLACLFLFLPTAAVAVGYSFLVSRREQAGDRTGAAKASRLARTWCLASLASFTVLILAAAAGMPV